MPRERQIGHDDVLVSPAKVVLSEYKMIAATVPASGSPIANCTVWKCTHAVRMTGNSTHALMYTRNNIHAVRMTGNSTHALMYTRNNIQSTVEKGLTLTCAVPHHKPVAGVE